MNVGCDWMLLITKSLDVVGFSSSLACASTTFKSSLDTTSIGLLLKKSSVQVSRSSRLRLPTFNLDFKFRFLCRGGTIIFEAGSGVSNDCFIDCFKLISC